MDVVNIIFRLLSPFEERLRGSSMYKYCKTNIYQFICLNNHKKTFQLSFFTLFVTESSLTILVYNFVKFYTFIPIFGKMYNVYTILHYIFLYMYIYFIQHCLNLEFYINDKNGIYNKTMLL